MSANESSKSDRYVPCPNCRNPSLFSSTNQFRPFCSERCRLIDLGEWASENFRVPLTSENDGLQGEIKSNSDVEDDSDLE